MTESDRDHEAALRSADAEIEALLQASDEEIEQRIRAAGEEPKEVAERLRQRLFEAVDLHREQVRTGRVFLRTCHLMELGTALRDLRVARRLTQSDVAARSGVAASQLSRWERGHEMPTLPSLVKVLSAVRADLGDLQHRMLVAAGELPARHRVPFPHNLAWPLAWLVHRFQDLDGRLRALEERVAGLEARRHAD